MAITREAKEVILAGLTKNFKDAKGVVFAQYRGLSVNDVQTLRSELRAAKVDYKVAKKTLIKLAAKEMGYDIPKELMEGPIGVAFGYDDEIVAAQKMHEFAKKFEAIKLVGGLMDGKLMDAAMVNQLATIPSRDVLLAKLLGSMQAPLSGFVRTLNGVVAAFVRVTDAYREQKAEGAPAPEVVSKPIPTETEEAPAPEAAPEEVVAAEEVAAEAPAEEAPTEEAPAAEAAPEAAPEETPEA